MKLTDWQKHRLETLAMETLDSGDDLEWAIGSPLERFRSNQSLRDSEILLDSRTGCWFAMGKFLRSNRKLAWNPGPRPFEIRVVSVARFEDIEVFFLDWLATVKHVRAHLEAWPCETRGNGKGSILRSASRRELNTLAAALKSQKIDLASVLWQEKEDEYAQQVTLSFSRGDRHYVTIFHRQGDGLNCVLQPGRDISQEVVSVNNLDQFDHLIREWAVSVRMELEVPPSQTSSQSWEGLALAAQPRLRSLTLKGIRGFEEFHLDFNDNPRDLLLVIGPNGTGKTTLLRCIVLALLPDSLAAHFLAFSSCKGLMRQSARAAGIRLELEVGGQNKVYECQLELDKKGNVRLRRDVTPPAESDLPIFAYGAGRTTEGNLNHENAAVRAVHTLFRYDVSLADIATANLKLDTNPGRRESIDRDFLSIFGKDQPELLRADRVGGFNVFWDGTLFPLSAWADGYRLFYQWFVDLHLAAFEQGMGTQIVGVLLVDELELHLHPQVQSEVLRRLRAAFPDLLIIATTHSPIVTLSVGSDELVVLRKEGGDIVTSPAPNLKGLTVEDVVTDARLFDASPYPPERQERLDRWKELMAIPSEKISDQQSLELRKLTEELLTA